MNIKETKKNIIQAGHKAVEELIKVAGEKIVDSTLQFLVGYYLQNESVNTNQLLGFVGVWTGLIMYSYGLIKEK